MTFNKVLVAFDGSEGSKKALQTALDGISGNITVITVVDDEKKAKISIEDQPPLNHLNPVVSNGLYQYAIEEEVKMKNRHNEEHMKQREEVTEKGNQLLLEAKHIVANNNDVAETETLIGDAAKAICHYAESHEFDLIVIGNRGLSGLKKLIQGSVSQKVIQDVSCPVLVVK